MEQTLAQNRKLLETEPYATIVKKQREVIQLRNMLPKEVTRALKWE